MKNFIFQLDLFGVNYDKMSKAEIKRSVNSLQKRINEHEKKIESPSRYDKTWNKKNEKQQQGIIKHWEKEITSFKKQKQEAEEYLKGSRKNEIRKRSNNGTDRQRH